MFMVMVSWTEIESCSISCTGSGTIELDEFISMMHKRYLEVDEEAELRDSFKLFDKDG